MCQTKAEAIRVHCSCIEDTALDRFIGATVKLAGKCLWWTAKKSAIIAWVTVAACSSLAFWVVSSTIDGILFVLETVILWIWNGIGKAMTPKMSSPIPQEAAQVLVPQVALPAIVDTQYSWDMATIRNKKRIPNRQDI